MAQFLAGNKDNITINIMTTMMNEIRRRRLFVVKKLKKYEMVVSSSNKLKTWKRSEMFRVEAEWLPWGHEQPPSRWVGARTVPIKMGGSTNSPHRDKMGHEVEQTHQDRWEHKHPYQDGWEHKQSHWDGWRHEQPHQDGWGREWSLAWWREKLSLTVDYPSWKRSVQTWS